MLKLETKSDLDRLIEEDIQESLTLDYKDARALEKTDQKRNELCKDVSAFANSAGEQIIYGVVEQGHHPVRVQDDDAVNPAEISREWVEQVIDSKVQPRIHNLHIQPIDVASGRVAYVITIPQATTNAPHQAPDNKYYYRQNFRSVPMEDYQVRDTMRRATTPELFVKLSFASGTVAPIEFLPRSQSQDEVSKPIMLQVFIGNRSPKPAFHTIVQLGIDTNLHVLTFGDFKQIGPRTDAINIQLNWWELLLSSPALPIFKESELRLASSLTLGVPYVLFDPPHPLNVATSVQTPGYTATEKWLINPQVNPQGPSLTLCEPGHPMNRAEAPEDAFR
jgi:Putative DNA-binding domain